MTSAFFRAVGVKNCGNLPTESSKKTADGRGVGLKNCRRLKWMVLMSNMCTSKNTVMTYLDGIEQNIHTYLVMHQNSCF